MSAINREDAIEAILSRLAKREEPCPPWIYATIRECLDDLPSLPSEKPLVYDGFYLCDKKPGACPSWERKGWTKCMSKHCNRTSRLDHALKLPDDGWIPCSERFPEEEQGVLICNKSGDIWIASGSYSTEIDEWIWYLDGRRVGPVIAWRPLPKPYNSKEDK